jgi:tripeptide aminopeptidase
MLVTFNGVPFHPGYAKGKLVNSIKIASAFLERIPKDKESPETTEKMEGYLHPHSIQGSVENTTIKFTIRDFEVEGLKRKEELLKTLAKETVQDYPKSSFTHEVSETYRNMKHVLDENPQVMEMAISAVRAAGLEPRLHSIRGGTDGALLSYMGLPTPNLGTGGHNFHSKVEWISIQDMRKAVEIVVNLVRSWAKAND